MHAELQKKAGNGQRSGGLKPPAPAAQRHMQKAPSTSAPAKAADATGAASQQWRPIRIGSDSSSDGDSGSGDGGFVASEGDDDDDDGSGSVGESEYEYTDDEESEDGMDTGSDSSYD